MELQVLINVAVAMGLGAVVGFERETAEKPAGLRTHMLVAGAAALLVALGEVTLTQYQDGAPGRISPDPIRIIVAVVTGVSFLGAGTIIRGHDGVHGLTTAAALLMTAAIGIAVGLAQTMVAGGVTLLTLVVLRVIPAVSRRLSR